MSSQNTISGTSRKQHTTPQGVLLERGYVYLTPEAWKALYAASSASGISASQHISALITPTANGATSIKDSNDTASTLHRSK
jgi:hypothetical protein